MSDLLSPSELQIIRSLSEKGLSKSEAMISVILLTRSYSRPEPELVATLRAYAGLEDSSEVASAISSLMNMGWLKVVEDYGKFITIPHPDLRQKLAEYVNVPEVSERLLELRKLNDPSVHIVGPLSDARPYTTFLQLLESSQFQVNYVGIATAADDHDQTPILISRARWGVRVRVLLAKPSVAASIRGQSIGTLARERLRQWRKIARRTPNLYVRMTGHKEDLALAASGSIDKRILRLVVYEHSGERSKQGVVVEFSRGSRSYLNIVYHFDATFDRAWRRARPIGLLSGLASELRRLWTPIVATITGIMALTAHRVDTILFSGGLSDQAETVVISILASISASFWFLFATEVGSAFRSRDSSDQRDGSER